MFGNNRFELPIYEVENGIWVNCVGNIDYERQNTGNMVGKLIFILDQEELNRDEKVQLERIENRYSDNFSFVQVKKDSSEAYGIKNCLNIPDYLKKQEKETNLINSNWLLFTDALNQVRGYYVLGDLDDVDRLLIELDIFLRYYVEN